VIEAARNPTNGLQQADEFDARERYQLRAALPTTYVNVVCVNVNKTDLAGMVYEAHPGTTLNATRDLSESGTYWYMKSMDWDRFLQFNTSLDDIFGWDDDRRKRPAFYKFPVAFNTIVNTTRALYGIRDSIYVLGTPDQALSRDDHFLCAIKAGLTPECSTSYIVSAGVGTLSLRCGMMHDPWRYDHKVQTSAALSSLDWFDVGASALISTDLDAGLDDGHASSARYLTQTALREPTLSSKLPSAG
jgi:hypothetical protein